MIYLDYLPYHAHRLKESFDTHVWMLKNLLNQVSRDETVEMESGETFLLYIIAVSFIKMRRRMEKNDISIAYFECLQNLKTFKYPSVDSDSDSDSDSGVQPQIKRESDSFFATIVDYAAVMEKRGSLIQISNLVQAAKLKQQNIYNESTYMEFHAILCDILSRFKKSLVTLADLDSDKKKDLEEIISALKSVRAYGYALRQLVKSSTVEKHLKTIAKANVLKVDKKKKCTQEPDLEEDPDYEDFERLRVRSFLKRKGKVISPWQSYRDWLRLMVHYFDAAEVLIKYTDIIRPNDMSILILSPPIPDRQILPWVNLLSNNYYFPTPDGQIQGEEFIKLIREDMESAGQILNVSHRYGLSFYENLQRGPLSNGQGTSDTYHCEAYIASLLTVALDHRGQLSDEFKDYLEKLSPEEGDQMKDLLDKVKASLVFMPHWKT